MRLKKNRLVFFMFAYWHDARFKNQAGGPIKVYELSDNLKKIGHTVFLFVPRLGFPEKQTSAHVVPVPFIDLPILRFISFQFLSILWFFWIVIRQKRPDIIYVRIMWSPMPILLGKIFRIPIILEINDCPYRAYGRIQNTFKKRTVHLIDHISCRFSDRVLSVTEKILEDLHRHEGLPFNIMAVLPSGANTELFHPMNKHYCCNVLGLEFHRTYVGFIGTFFHHQGVDILIDAAPLILEKYPHTCFLLVGDGPMRTSWENKVSRMKLKEQFVFTGYVPYRDVPLYCGAMDICTAPFLKEVGQSSGVKIFDYMACGRPVVMSDINGTGEFWRRSGAVLFFQAEKTDNLSRSVLRLLRNQSLREEMGKKARKFVDPQYSRKKIARDVESIAFRLKTGNLTRSKHFALLIP